MKILNPNNLPQTLVNAVTPKLEPPNLERMSVTDLIGPPMKRYLKAVNWDKITAPVEDFTWMMFGKAFHYIMDKYAPEGAITEEKLELEMPSGHTLVGVSDHRDNKLRDFKVTSVWSFILGDKTDWEKQLNIYDYMAWKIHGWEGEGLEIVAILRDWNKREARKDARYPSSPIHIVQVKRWTHEEQEKYILESLADHVNLRECTPEERWRKPTTFAVKVPNVDKAKKVEPTLESAQEWIVNNEKKLKGVKPFIEVRQGEDTRCMDYCDVAEFCPCNIYNKKEEINA